MRNLRYIIRNRDRFAADSGEDREISCGREIGTQQTTPPDLELDPQECVQYLDVRGPRRRVQFIASGSLSEYPVSVDQINAEIPELLANLATNIFSPYRPGILGKVS